MSISLYRKYRPQDFASVVGQAPAVSILTNALTKGSAGHAYLFSGSRGCGKTSIARIFAKALNCLHPNGYEPCGTCTNCTAVTAGESLDVVEIDGASNNGVENIRNIRSNVNLAPFSSKHKIYIIDEVHMLSQGAFNALLKTLEEPPEYVIFIMATTEPYKVPVTIRSRCQHIPFHSISTEDIASRLEFVCRSEGVTADTEALYEIARQADGALRDGLSLLEQVISSGEITLSNVEALLGAGSRSAFERIIHALRTDPSQGYISLKAMFDGGASAVRVFEELFSVVRNMWLVSRWGGMIDGLGLSKKECIFLTEEVPNWRADTLHYMLDRTLKALTQARQGIRTDILLGAFMLSLTAAPEPPAQQEPPVKQEPPPVKQEVSPVQQEVSPVKQEVSPVQQEVSPVKQEVSPEFDPKLTLELLKIAQKAKSEIYCALFDAQAHVDDKGLILEFRHKYCYSRFLVEQHRAQLCVMFGDYGNVFVRYRGLEDVLCTTSEPVPTIKYPEYYKPERVILPIEEDAAQESIPADEDAAVAQKSIPVDEDAAVSQESTPVDEDAAVSQESTPVDEDDDAVAAESMPVQEDTHHTSNALSELLGYFGNYEVLLRVHNTPETIDGGDNDND